MRELEQELRELAAAVELPVAPELAAHVRSRLPDRPQRVWPRRSALIVAAAVVVVGVALAVPAARTAIFDFFDIGAVRVQFVERLPVIRRSAPLGLGRRIRPGNAPFRLLGSSLLGDADAAYQDGVVVSLLYGSPTRVRLLVTEVYESGFTPAMGKKLIGTGTRISFVQIHGADGPGVWLEGLPHVVFLPGGPPRVAADTLIWRRGAITLRLEGAESLAQAIEIAQSFR
jgi:hypothetical protein